MPIRRLRAKHGSHAGAIWIGLLLSSLTFACQQEHHVGSQCQDGRCAALTLPSSECLVTDLSAGLALTGTLSYAALCTPQPLARSDSGRVQCRVTARMTAAACESLEHGSHNGQADDQGRVDCELDQVVLSESPVSGVAGWYYDDFSDLAATECSSPHRIVVAAPPPDADLRFNCLSALAMVQEVAPSAVLDSKTLPIQLSRCAAPQPLSNDASDVGDPCTPGLLPKGGYSSEEVHLAIGSSSCASDVCLTYQLEGDPTQDCVAGRCLSDEELLKHRYCSCRCSTPAGVAADDETLCTCPDRFTCTDILEGGPTALAGGYCARSETVLP